MAGDNDLRIQLRAEDVDFTSTVNKLLRTIDRLEHKTEEAARKQETAWRRMDQAAKQFSVGMSRATRVVGRLLMPLGRLQTMLMTGGVVYGLKRATKAAADFQMGLAEISTLLTGNVAPQMQRFREGIEKMVLTSSKSLQDLTKGLYQTISSGVTDTTKALKTLDLAQRAAVAGLSSVETSVDALTTLINSFRLSEEGAEKAADLLFTTIRRGRLTFTPLANQIGKVTTLASQAGVSMEEMFAAVSTLTKAGLDVDMATTALRQFFAAILNPSKEAAESFNLLGIRFGAGAMKGGEFSKTLERIHRATGGNAETLTKLVPNIRALMGALVLTGDQLKVYNEDLREMESSAGALGEAFAKISDQAREKISVQWQRLALQAEKLGEQLLPDVVKALTAVADAFDRITADDIRNGLMFVKEALMDIGSFAASAAQGVYEVFKRASGAGLIEVVSAGAGGGYTDEEVARLRAAARQRREFIESVAESRATAIMGRDVAPEFQARYKRAEGLEGQRAVAEEAARTATRFRGEAAFQMREAGREGVSRQQYEIHQRVSVQLANEARELEKLMEAYRRSKLEAEQAAAGREQANRLAAAAATKAADEEAKARLQSGAALLKRWEREQLNSIERYAGAVAERYNELIDIFRGNKAELIKIEKLYAAEQVKIWDKLVEKGKESANKLKRAWELSRPGILPTGPAKPGQGVSGRPAIPGSIIELIAQRGQIDANTATMLLQGQGGLMQNQLVANITKGAGAGSEAGPKGMIIGAIVGLVATLIESNREQFEESMDQLLEVVIEMPDRLMDNAEVLITKIGEKLPEIIVSALKMYDLALAVQEGVAEALRRFWAVVKGYFTGAKQREWWYQKWKSATSKSTWEKIEDYGTRGISAIGRGTRAVGDFIGNQAMGYVGRVADIYRAARAGDIKGVGKSIGSLVAEEKLGAIGKVIGKLFHEGGMVASPEFASNVVAIGDAAKRLRKAHSGAFMTLKPDEVPAVLQTGEGVLSRRGMQALEQLNQGGRAAGGGSVTINASVITTDEVDRWIDQRVARAVSGGGHTSAALGGRTNRVPGKTYRRR